MNFDPQTTEIIGGAREVHCARTLAKREQKHGGLNLKGLVVSVLPPVSDNSEFLRAGEDASG